MIFISHHNLLTTIRKNGCVVITPMKSTEVVLKAFPIPSVEAHIVLY